MSARENGGCGLGGEEFGPERMICFPTKCMRCMGGKWEETTRFWIL